MSTRFVLVSTSSFYLRHYNIPFLSAIISSAITTVGYGEITPRSFLGRLVTLPLLVFGLLLIALPSFVLGREFSLVWEKMTAQHVSFDFISLYPHMFTHFNGLHRKMMMT